MTHFKGGKAKLIQDHHDKLEGITQKWSLTEGKREWAQF